MQYRPPSATKWAAALLAAAIAAALLFAWHCLRPLLE